MVRAFLEAGATVIAPARSPASQARLQSELAALPGAAEGRLPTMAPLKGRKRWRRSSGSCAAAVWTT